jgi:hypothetical protein
VTTTVQRPPAHRTDAACAAILLLTGLIGCTPAPAPAPTGVVSPSLGIALSELPAGFAVSRNQAGILELAPSAAGIGGLITFRLGPEDANVNLIAAMSEDQRRVEGLPGGEYKGGQELAGPLGPAFYSRGRHQDGDTVREETAVYTVHPDGPRLLEIRYAYPAAADSAERVSQLLAVLAVVEAAPPANAG